MNIYGGLLFMQGHITNVELAKQLVGEQEPVAVPMATDALLEGRRGRVCGTVENMDVFYEPPGMDSRRVPQTRTGRP